MTFNTGNNVPSTDPRDLYDNAENLDKLVNGAEPFYADRLGKLRESWAGMENSFTNAQEGRETAFTLSQADKESRFQAFLVSSGYVSKGDYASGVVLAERNEYVAVDAATTGTTAGLYRPGPGATLPLALTGTWATDAANLVLLGDDVLRQELAESAQGAGLVGFDSTVVYPDGSVGKALSGVINLPTIAVLDAPTDGTDVTMAVVEFFDRVKANKLYWLVPAGDYSINPEAPIDIVSSGICQGRFIVPNSNQSFRFQIVRDAEGQVIPTTGWGAISRGGSDVQAANAAGKNLYLSSTEIQIERIGSGGAPYLKQEFIRCMPSGSFSTPAVNTYNSFSNLTVTAHEPSAPIRIDGLSVRLVGALGGIEVSRGFIVVNRDSVTLNSPQVINTNTAQPRPVAIENGYCADTVINSPKVRGFSFEGLGYGILNASSIGLTVNQADLQDCRHGYTGVFTVDVTLNGGNFGRVIDDHWTDRFVANSPKVYALPGSSSFTFAGNDVTINDPVISGGRNLFGIRNDTPHMGGKVIIRNPIIATRGESGYYYLFGFASPNGEVDPGFAFTNQPKLPDLVEISNPSIDSDTAEVYGAYLGMLYFPHTAWGTIRLKGSWKTTGSNLTGVFAYKDATHQRDRTPLIDISGVDCGTGNLLYITALDAVTTRAFSVQLGQGAAGNLRYSGASVGQLEAAGARIGSITDDAATVAPAGFYRFVGCTFNGGAVSTTIRNHLISSSIFSGNYSQFPAAASISMDGNVRTGSGITGLPADIRNNIVTPFAT